MAFITHSFTTFSRNALPRTSRLLHSTSPRMLSKGDNIPMDLDLMILKDGTPTPVSTKSLFSSKKVAVVTVPGALTSTCQNAHVPQWVKAADQLREKGIDDIYCVSVNDPFVMSAFEEAVGANGKVTFLGDGGGQLVTKLGIDVDTGNFGGVRAMRGCYLVDDGVFTQVNLENGTSYEGPSKPETLMAQL